MTYHAMTMLAGDGGFIDRLRAVLVEESKVRAATDDPYAVLVLYDSLIEARRAAMPIATQPTFATRYAADGQSAITDLDLLASVQSLWTVLAKTVAYTAAPRPT